MFRAPRVRGRLGHRRYRERLRCRPRWGLCYRHRARCCQNSSSKGHRHPKSWGCPHCRCHRRHCFHLERRFRFPSQKHCPPPNRKRCPRPRRRSPRQTHRWSLRLPEPRDQQDKHSMPHQRRKTPHYSKKQLVRRLEQSIAKRTTIDASPEGLPIGRPRTAFRPCPKRAGGVLPTRAPLFPTTDRKLPGLPPR